MLVRRARPQQDSAESLEAVLADDILVADLLAKLEEYRAAGLRLHRLREVAVDQEHLHLLDGRPCGLLDGLLVGLFLLLDAVDVPVGDVAGELTRSAAAFLRPLLVKVFRKSEALAIVLLDRHLGLVVQVMRAGRLGAEILLLGRRSVAEQPCDGVRDRRLARAVHSEDVGVLAVEVDVEFADAAEVLEPQV